MREVAWKMLFGLVDEGTDCLLLIFLEKVAQVPSEVDRDLEGVAELVPSRGCQKSSL